MWERVDVRNPVDLYFLDKTRRPFHIKCTKINHGAVIMMMLWAATFPRNFEKAAPLG
jgi:hypothetical protein